MAVSVALVGDVMLGRGVNAALRTMPPEEPWGDTLALLLAADHRIINLECALTRHLQPWMRTFKAFHFRADPSAVEVLTAASVDACSLANNHTLDFEEQGLLETLGTLDAAGVRHAGAGRNGEEAARPALLAASSGEPGIGLVAFTDNEPPFAAGPDRPGTNYLPVSLDAPVLQRVEEGIAAARAGGAKTVIVSNHWGPNMVERPPQLFRDFAHAVIERGADLYYGHSAHLFQGIELYRGKPILYDTGDYIDDYAIDPVLRNDRSFLFLVTVDPAPVRVELVPVLLTYARANVATGAEREAILARMASLSGEMGTAFVRRDDRLVLEIPG